MRNWLVIVGCVVLIGLSIAWSIFQWNECKEMGHTTFYCIGHILK